LGLVLIAVATGLVLTLRADGAGRKRGGKAGGDKKGAPNGGVLGQPESFPDTGVREPSGVAFDARRGRMFVVGDEGTLSTLDRNGSRLATVPAPIQVEDVAVLPDGSLLLVRELGGELIAVDAETGKEKRRWRLDKPALLGRRGGLNVNAGFEGLAFRPGAQRPGSGVLYLVHQRSPAAIVAVAFDPGAPGDLLGAEAVRSRWDLDEQGELTAATYVPSLDRVLAIADARDRLLVLGPDGGIEASIPLPGVQQEGLSFDDKGALWVADDRGGRLMRFAGALEGIAGALRAHSTEPK
jgi:uncharacterized protein YjiK